MTTPFRLPLYLPAQGASETEATLIEWHVAEGDEFPKGKILAQVDSAKSVFDFEAPCAGRVIRLLFREGESVAYAQPVMEIETADPEMRDAIPPAAAIERPGAAVQPARQTAPAPATTQPVMILGFGGYLPERVVTNAELLREFPDLSEDYVYQVTGIRTRRWAAEGEKPSSMAFRAAQETFCKSGIAPKEIDALILATTTPDAAMPSTACILQDRLGLPNIPAFDLNAACSGWLFAVAMARNMILSGMARKVLTVGVDLQSRLLEPADRGARFIFGDGAGAAIVAAGTEGHPLCEILLAGDATGLTMARREAPGYLVCDGRSRFDPWIRLDGQALFRAASEDFAAIIRGVTAQSGWAGGDVRWVVPHQANRRILKASAKRSGVSFDRFFLNIESLGNTSSASIPLALVEMEPQLRPGDKLVLCSVGAGLTSAAISMQW
jgi:3-oxoacyl-(acyl-carrier-protein) synthase III